MIFSVNKFDFQAPKASTLTNPFVTIDDEDLIKVRNAISSGELICNVSQVRKYLNCGQSKAQDICRKLRAQQSNK